MPMAKYLNKLDNPRFVDKETIPLVQDEDYLITIHWIQAGQTRHHSQNLMPENEI